MGTRRDLRVIALVASCWAFAAGAVFAQDQSQSGDGERGSDSSDRGNRGSPGDQGTPQVNGNNSGGGGGIGIISDGKDNFRSGGITRPLTAAPTGKPGSPGVRAQFTRPSGPVGRNAIGLEVTGSSGKPPLPHLTPAVPASVSGAPPNNATGTIAGSPQPPQAPAFGARSAPPHLGGINGSAMGHVGGAASSVGGPAKNLTGINGTTIRPGH